MRFATRQQDREWLFRVYAGRLVHCVFLGAWAFGHFVGALNVCDHLRGGGLD